MKVIPLTAAILAAALTAGAVQAQQQVVPSPTATTTTKPAGNAVAIAQKQEAIYKLQAERDQTLAPLKTELETWTAAEKLKIDQAAAAVKTMREKYKTDRQVKRDAIAKVKTDFAARIDALKSELVALRKS